MSSKAKLNILAISGSLKLTSSNSIILSHLSQYKQQQINFVFYNELESIPAFNPDKEEGTPAVTHFKKLLKEADGVIISTPEYAFGVPGSLKNALDWTVSTGDLNEKPVIAITASPLYEGGSKAMSSLLLTLGALGTNMSAASSLSIANSSKKISGGKVTDEQTQEQLNTLFEHLISTITTHLNS